MVALYVGSARAEIFLNVDNRTVCFQNSGSILNIDHLQRSLVQREIQLNLSPRGKMEHRYSSIGKEEFVLAEIIATVLGRPLLAVFSHEGKRESGRVRSFVEVLKFLS